MLTLALTVHVIFAQTPLAPEALTQPAPAATIRSRPLAMGGAITFGVAYLANAAFALPGLFARSDGFLGALGIGIAAADLVPVLGPLLLGGRTLADGRDPGVGTLLVVDGLAQGAGLIMLAIGCESALSVQASPTTTLRLTPGAARSPLGASLSVSWQ